MFVVFKGTHHCCLTLFILCMQILWPWSGNLALFIRVLPSGKEVLNELMGTLHFNVLVPTIHKNETLTCMLPLNEWQLKSFHLPNF